MVFPVFLTCGPNEVLVVSGVGYNKPAMLTGGCVMAFPCLQRWKRLALNVMTIRVDSPAVYTAQGVSIKVTGVAQVKINTQHPQLLALACEHFLEKSRQEIVALITETLEGHQRAILGTMTVEEIYKNRELFNTRVFEVAFKDLYNLGLHVISYTVRDLSDDLGYLQALGMSRTAQVKRDAKIGEAAAKRDTVIKNCLAYEQLVMVKFANETLIAKAERDYNVQKLIYDREVKTKEAEASLAYQLQCCKINQKIREENMETKVVEKKGRILVGEQEITRRQKQLDSTVRQPAEAEKYRMETIATALKTKTLLEVEAEAEAKSLKADAEASAINAKAVAEAANNYYKAEAWKEFGDAAILSMYLDTIPQMVHSVSSSLSKTKSVKMVSTGDAPLGALKITQEVIGIANSVPEMVRNITGIDLSTVKDVKTAERNDRRNFLKK